MWIHREQSHFGVTFIYITGLSVYISETDFVKLTCILLALEKLKKMMLKYSEKYLKNQNYIIKIFTQWKIREEQWNKKDMMD